MAWDMAWVSIDRTGAARGGFGLSGGFAAEAGLGSSLCAGEGRALKEDTLGVVRDCKGRGSECDEAAAADAVVVPGGFRGVVVGFDWRERFIPARRGVVESSALSRSVVIHAGRRPPKRLFSDWLAAATSAGPWGCRVMLNAILGVSQN